MGINIDTISTHSSCFQNGSMTTYYTEHTFSVAKIRPAFIRMQHDTDLSAAVRCDKHIPPSVIIVAKQRFSAHANHRYIGSSRVIPKLAISHSTTFPVADLAPTMVLLQCGDTSQDSELGSDKTCGSMLHLATGIRQKCDLKCVPSCCEERAFTRA